VQTKPEDSLTEKAAMFRTMSLIRNVELTLLRLFDEGKLSGTTHTCIGQEVVSAALASATGPEDVVFSTHRCHGHFLARGGPLKELFAEIMGRESAICGGRGGSQHLHYRNFFSNGVQGGVAGNATGMALAEKLKKSGNVVVAFLGDGTLGEGLVYESLNFASLQDLPVVFVLEHNRYAQSTPSHLGVSGSIAARPAAFGIQTEEVDTQEPDEVVTALRRCVSLARDSRPVFLVVHTYRLAPHSKGDDTRDPDEIAAWSKKDPLFQLQQQLPDDLVSRVERDVQDLIAAALLEAEQAPWPATDRSGPVNPVPEGVYDAPFAAERLTYVQSINAGLLRALEAAPDCFVIGEDILDPYGGAFKATRGCSTRFPDRTLSTPVSEAGIVAWSTGAALRGLRPVAEIMFGDFLALAADQILNHASKYRWIYDGRASVPMVIRTPMGGRRGYGPTHSQSIESMFVGVPGLAIVAPPPLLDPGSLLFRAITEGSDPTLFIEDKSLYSQRLMVVENGRCSEFFVQNTSSFFPTLHMSLARSEEPDIILVTYGGSVPIAVEVVRRLLLEREILCDLVIPAQLSPLPAADIHAFAGSARKVAVLEEGPVRGGWGAEVIAALAERGQSGHRSYLRIGAQSSPIPSSKYLEMKLLPGVESVFHLLSRF
jgi:2-oxoisovalerate dehydrogenase E1 component